MPLTPLTQPLEPPQHHPPPPDGQGRFGRELSAWPSWMRTVMPVVDVPEGTLNCMLVTVSHLPSLTVQVLGLMVQEFWLPVATTLASLMTAAEQQAQEMLAPPRLHVLKSMVTASRAPSPLTTYEVHVAQSDVAHWIWHVAAHAGGSERGWREGHSKGEGGGHVPCPALLPGAAACSAAAQAS